MLRNLLSSLRAAPAASPKAETPPPAPERPARREPALPPRRVEGRREFRGLLWFPVLVVQDDEKLVVAAKAGLPHCPGCQAALALVSRPKELWECAACGTSRPGAEADFFVSESVLAQDLQEFFAAHPDFRAAPGLSAPVPLAA